jgi:glutamate decarboxylase
MLARLWGCSRDEPAIGCSTTGSSEAAMLGGMALKRRWAQRRRAAGLAADRPNLVMGANVQVCWEKFCRYWDVEARLVPVGAGSTCLTAAGAAASCDENTIGVVAILGSTFDGAYEPVSDIAAALDRLRDETGIDVPIHVDAASGGFVAPFIDPGLQWDFRIARVASINASGHKYGLVYPGVGWALWRDSAALPQDLIFHVDYLGGDMPTFALNFSRPGAQVVAQYYTLLRLGFEGYRRVQQSCRDNATWLAAEIAAIGPFELISDGSGIPVFAFRLREDVDRYTVFDVSETLRIKGWLVPAYHMPAAMQDVAVLRVVVRNDFSQDLAGMLLDHLRWAVTRLERAAVTPTDEDSRSAFHH